MIPIVIKKNSTEFISKNLKIILHPSIDLHLYNFQCRFVSIKWFCFLVINTLRTYPTHLHYILILATVTLCSVNFYFVILFVWFDLFVWFGHSQIIFWIILVYSWIWDQGSLLAVLPLLSFLYFYSSGDSNQCQPHKRLNICTISPTPSLILLSDTWNTFSYFKTQAK